MTTPSTPAAPTPEPIPPAQPSESVTTPQGETPESQQEPPKYVTQEELEQRDAELIRRLKQSDRDRSKAIDGKLTEIKEMLVKAGTTVTPEQEAALRNQITDQIDGAEPQPQGQSAVPAPQGNPVDVLLAQVFAETGTQVTPNDPEWKDFQAVLDKTWSDPNGLPKVLVAATKASNAKAQRTAAMQESAAARVGGGGQTITGDTSALSAHDLWEIAHDKR